MTVALVEKDQKGKKLLDDVVKKVNKKRIMKKIMECVPIDKAQDVAHKTLLNIYIANRNPEIEKVYSIYSNSEKDGFIRSVRIKVDGYYDHSKTFLEKYNTEIDAWEEYEYEKQSIEEIKSQISDVQYKIQTAAWDIGVISKMLDELPESDQKDILNFDGLQLLGRILKEKSELLVKEGDKLDELSTNIPND